MAQRGEPLQIISTVAKDGNSEDFVLEKENLRSVTDKIPKDCKIAVVSVVGAFRTGKSFLLTLLLRYLRHGGQGGDVGEDWMSCDGESLSEGNCNSQGSGSSSSSGSGGSSSGSSFAWRGGHDRMTTGIWMWSEPFLHALPGGSGEKVAVLLMDTQGMFDNETTMTLTAQIFGISTLVSSLQIYNIQNRISEDHLQHLALFSEYGRIAHQRGDADADEKEKAAAAAGGNTTAAAATLTTAAPKPFQRLQFLVRDWANFSEAWPEEDGGGDADKRNREDETYTRLRGEMRDYLVKLTTARNDADLQSTRDQIARCFERVDCFLLTHPGIAATRPNYNGSIKALDSSFRGLVGRFARLVFDEQLEPKRVLSRHITAIELANYFEAYVALFQSGKGFPKAMTILDATAEANNRCAYDLAVGRYIEAMGPQAGPGSSDVFIKESELLVKHQQAESTALAKFAEVATMGSAKGATKTRELLEEFLRSEAQQRVALNALRNPFKDYEKHVLPALVAIVSWLCSVVLSATCSTQSCKVVEKNFSSLFWIVAIFLIFVFWKKLASVFAYIKNFVPPDMLEAIPAALHSTPTPAPAVIGGKKSSKPNNKSKVK